MSLAITYSLPPENMRRYGKAWIGRIVTWPVGQNPTIVWGANIDDDNAEIAAKAGDLVRCGRKDHRGRNTINDFMIVQTDGSLVRTTPAAARKYFLERAENEARERQLDRFDGQP